MHTVVRIERCACGGGYWLHSKRGSAHHFTGKPPRALADVEGWYDDDTGGD